MKRLLYLLFLLCFFFLQVRAENKLAEFGFSNRSAITKYSVELNEQKNLNNSFQETETNLKSMNQTLNSVNSTLIVTITQTIFYSSTTAPEKLIENNKYPDPKESDLIKNLTNENFSNSQTNVIGVKNTHEINDEINMDLDNDEHIRISKNEQGISFKKEIVSKKHENETELSRLDNAIQFTEMPEFENSKIVEIIEPTQAYTKLQTEQTETITPEEKNYIINVNGIKPETTKILQTILNNSTSSELSTKQVQFTSTYLNWLTFKTFSTVKIPKSIISNENFTTPIAASSIITSSIRSSNRTTSMIIPFTIASLTPKVPISKITTFAIFTSTSQTSTSSTSTLRISTFTIAPFKSKLITSTSSKIITSTSKTSTLKINTFTITSSNPKITTSTTMTYISKTISSTSKTSAPTANTKTLAHKINELNKTSQDEIILSFFHSTSTKIANSKLVTNLSKSTKSQLLLTTESMTTSVSHQYKDEDNVILRFCPKNLENYCLNNGECFLIQQKSQSLSEIPLNVLANCKCKTSPSHYFGVIIVNFQGQRCENISYSISLVVIAYFTSSIIFLLIVTILIKYKYEIIKQKSKKYLTNAKGHDGSKLQNTKNMKKYKTFYFDKTSHNKSATDEKDFESTNTFSNYFPLKDYPVPFNRSINNSNFIFSNDNEATSTNNSESAKRAAKRLLVYPKPTRFSMVKNQSDAFLKLQKNNMYDDAFYY